MICTLAPNTSILEAQISFVKIFTEENFLKLNPSKCEVVAFKKAEELLIQVKSELMNVASLSERQLLVLDISGSMTCHLRTQLKFVFKKLVGPSFNMVVFMHFKES